jgi:hypothetical protein
MTPGTVYRDYACGCTHTDDVKPVRIRIPELDARGNRKRASVCPHHKSIKGQYITRWKICPTCGKRIEGAGIKPGPCRDCNQAKRLKDKKPTRAPLSRDRVTREQLSVSQERSDCVWRDNCTYRCGAWDMQVMPCLGCPRYEPVRYEMGVTGSRSYDPCAWAYGEAV